MVITCMLVFRLGKEMCNVPDASDFTPIITAYVGKEKELASQLIAKILSSLASESTDKCIDAIKYPYHGLPLIEYDIKNKEGVIIKVLNTAM